MSTPFLNPAQTVEDLRNTAAFLEAHEWIKGADFDGNGGYCAFGALRYVTGDLSSTPQVGPSGRERSTNAARAFYRTIGQEITSFNDIHATSKEHVLDTLRRVAEILEENPHRA